MCVWSPCVLRCEGTPISQPSARSLGCSPSLPALCTHCLSRADQTFALACLLTLPGQDLKFSQPAIALIAQACPCASLQSLDNLPPSFMITASSEDLKMGLYSGCPGHGAVPVDKLQETGMVVTSKERKWKAELRRGNRYEMEKLTILRLPGCTEGVSGPRACPLPAAVPLQHLSLQSPWGWQCPGAGQPVSLTGTRLRTNQRGCSCLQLRSCQHLPARSSSLVCTCSLPV